MISILAATTNRGKIREIDSILSGLVPGLRLFTPTDLGIAGSPDENGETFLANSVIKSVFYSGLKHGILTIADDSGLMVHSLNGEPGIRSARYAGEDTDDRKNIRKLLKELAGRPERSATFVSVITLSMDGRVIRSFTGEANGRIIDDQRGNNGFGYDPVFFYEPLGKTFAEMTAEEKGAVSHRAAALHKLGDFLRREGS